MLADPSPAEPSSASLLLPLTPGNRWTLTTAIEPILTEEYVVGQKMDIAGAPGVVVDCLRSGKPWRREVYQQSRNGLALLAFGDSGKPLMTLSPPLYLTRASVAEGDTLSWTGTVRVNGRAVGAKGFSRVSLKETSQTLRVGINSSYRIDTIVTLQIPDAPATHFPTIRWLSPHIGFVRRAYVDNGQAVQSELSKMELH